MSTYEAGCMIGCILVMVLLASCSDESSGYVAALQKYRENDPSSAGKYVVTGKEPTRAQFLAQCKPRYGSGNPERMKLEHWEWMVRVGVDPFLVRDGFGIEHDWEAPDWCFDRFGMSKTIMPDGRVIRIAGEHEDYYDPDFCIYNDVIVLRPVAGGTEVTASTGEVEIYGYPEEVFPPTDFHSATLVGDRIYIIGSLGYPEERRHGSTPVFVLDTHTYGMQRMETSGPAPGWIYKHHASYDSQTNSIVVRGGNIDTPDAKQETPHVALHRLHLADMRWELINEHEPRVRFLIGAATEGVFVPEDKAESILNLKNVASIGLQLSQDYEPFAISVDAVRVTFDFWVTEIRVTVEGLLPPEVTSNVLAEVASNLERETGVKWTVKEVEDFKEPPLSIPDLQ